MEDLKDKPSEPEEKLTKIDKVIEAIGHKLSWGYLLIVVISFYEIIARYVFNSPTDWVHETSIALAGFLMVYAGLFSYGRNKHIRVPILLDRVSAKWRNRLEIFSGIITLLFLGLLAYSSYFVAYSAAVSPTGEIVLERSGSAWNPPIPGLLKVAIFVLFVLFFIQVIWKLKQRLTNSNE
ncbi:MULTISPECIES: TRAP transporter small permease subunit [Gallibacterium]|uniref:TRAP transporter small permease protein n=1 Tax=Gallibacterium genomosp. 3 TaxID=505345 RepID=A0A1A7NRV3_9PAST|nr:MULTISPECIES: TRAP transporter small permease [Gallibacterium]MDA3979577.1 TRAP transporter small permease [Gallibacterium sp. AGMB14963]OBW91734.1 hypothetical protein QV01_06865 [Gallibacterium genomosp. 3]OBX09760.1 hypothetical protein QV07_04765 [Gallibacterium genomosp. 3]